VFPVRRRPAIVRLLIVVVVFGANPAVSLAINLHDGWGEVGPRLVSFAASLNFVGLCIWQLVTRRPVLIVDQDGIRFGRRKFMPWTDLGTIGTPTARGSSGCSPSSRTTSGPNTSDSPRTT
jgi:hypothetical protein